MAYPKQDVHLATGSSCDAGLHHVGLCFDCGMAAPPDVPTFVAADCCPCKPCRCCKAKTDTVSSETA